MCLRTREMYKGSGRVLLLLLYALLVFQPLKSAESV